MKISTKGRYGLKAMLDIALNSTGDQVPLKSIAERQNISDSYLEQVFSTLRKSGLVNSIKGAQGGYVLGRYSKDITVGDILRTLEGDLSVIDEKSAASNSDDIMEICITNNVWNKLNDSINKIVDSTTLEDLMQQYKRIEDNSSYIYYI